MTDELLPCPFCGSVASVRSVNGGVLPWVVEERGGVPERYYTTCTLWCDTCGAQIDGYAASDETAEGLYKQAIENCYNAWNSRAERTCHPKFNGTWFECDVCGWSLARFGVRTTQRLDGTTIRKMAAPLNYCPHCGCKVVS